MDQIKALLKEKMPQQHFDSISVAVIDFKTKKYETLEYHLGQFHREKVFYDLASLTKPLTLSFSFFKEPKLWEKKQLAWMLNHRACFPVWGRLSKSSWQESVNHYIPVINEVDVYSDFSALRLQLEIEKIIGQSLYDFVCEFWDKEVFSWLEHQDKTLSPITGIRIGKFIQGDVHDDNAFIIREKLSHAGLFGSIDGVCLTLLKANEKLALVSKMNDYFKDDEVGGRRFIRGWDSVKDPDQTLAGKGCDPYTFGHLGFTGTSIWVDSTHQKGHVILSNATQNYWYDKKGLNEIRRLVGQLAWKY